MAEVKTDEAFKRGFQFVFPGQVKWEILTGERGRLVVEPLEPGWGITIGNALRRVLLSSLEGYAITHVRIEGVEHEYGAVPGIYEDVMDILLNLKQVRFKKVAPYPLDYATIKVEVEGPCEVFARDIQKATVEFEVANPDLQICSIVDRVKLSMTLKVHKGRGYVPSEEFEDQTLQPGEIPMDAIFTPVKKVAFNVENVRVGKYTDYEKLIIDITTYGTITPDSACLQAIEILKQHLDIISKGVSAEQPHPAQKMEGWSLVVGASDLLKEPIEKLGITARVFQRLKEYKIETIGDLVAKTEKQLVEIPGIGKKAIEEIREALKEKGLKLAEG